MAITYPLALPTATGIRNIAFRARNAVAYNFSPFTFQGQAQAYSGQMWEADITLPPIKDRSDAEVWNAFILSLRGQLGTFTMGDPNGATARGTASTSAGSPVISSQIGSTIFVTGAPALQTGYLLQGDYVQFGSGSTATLHKVLADTNTNGSGFFNLEIWPGLRSSRSGAMVVSSPVGRFRLATNDTGWVADIQQYSITFSAREAI